MSREKMEGSSASMLALEEKSETSGSLPYDIQILSGKGRGLVATDNIPCGTRILCEKPLFTARKFSDAVAMETEIVGKLKKLTKSEQRQFLSLHNNFPGKYPFTGLVNTNALPCGPDGRVGGIYPTACLINHSCLPNAHNNWNDAKDHLTIHAIRDIKTGEEITISYEDGLPYKQRQKHLQKHFGFQCSCTLCSLGPETLETSDARRINIKMLDEAIGDIMAAPEHSLGACRRLKELLLEEYQGAPGAAMARLYYDAFQLCVINGDQARTSVFARRACEFRILCEGADSPNTERVKGFMEDPTTHHSYGISNEWKTSLKLVPTNLESNAFEEWLWKRADSLVFG